jgi:hypothetical protein
MNAYNGSEDASFFGMIAIGELVCRRMKHISSSQIKFALGNQKH